MIPAIAADGSLYPIDKLEAHRRGALHVAVSVFVFSGPELLIQRRAAGKYHSALTWANTCCSHPHWGEAVDHAAARRLGEELGLDVPLTAAGQISYSAVVSRGLIENERVHVFRGAADQDSVRLRVDPAEVAETRWAHPDQLRREVAADPAAFAPWFQIYLARWPELGL
ncbi:MAG: isopentenyl-diphosphate Delta-isomerase [Rhodospirillaceae bacterium]|nr:isopentenyl-diphosphate Delta-isomerase [Rhodospirillaceae bacterium]